MAQDGVNFDIAADIAPLVRAMDQATQKVAASTDAMKKSLESVGSSLAKVQTAFLAFAAVATGGEAIKKIVSASVDWATTNGKLAKALGISEEMASTYQVALHHLGLESDVLLNASVRLSRQIGTHSEDFAKLGVTLKDANGNYRPVAEVMSDVNAKLVAIQNPIAQNIAGMKVYGKGWAEIRPLLKLNADTMAEAKRRSEELGLAQGLSAAEGRKYQMQLRDIDLVGKSLTVQIGNKLLPVVAQVGSVFASVAPIIGEVFGGALKLVAEVAINLGAEVAALWFRVSGVMRAANALLHGNATEARQIMNDMAAQIDRINKKADDMIAKLRAPPPKAATPPDLSGKDPFADEDTTGKSRFSGWETKLAEAKAAFEEEARLAGQFREFDKAQELAYWQRILTLTKAGSDENLAVRRKIAEAKLAIDKAALEAELGRLKDQEAAAGKNADARLTIAKQYAARIGAAYGLESKAYADAAKQVIQIEAEKQAQLRELQNIRAGVERTRALQAIQSEEDDARMQLEIGQLTNTQLLQLERQFQNERNAIDRQALLDKRALVDPDRDPVEYAKVNAELEDLEIKHQATLAQIDRKVVVERSKQLDQLFAPMESGFSRALSNILKGNEKMGQAFRNMATQIAGSFADMASKNIASMLRQAATGNTIRLKEIQADAAGAAAGAYKAIVGIPYVGPVLAPIAAGAAFAAVGAYETLVSASGGYDIPANVNPVGQLHAREMVLPAGIADPLRQMIASGGGQGGGIRTQLVVSPVGDSHFIVTKDNLARHLSQLNQRFALG